MRWWTRPSSQQKDGVRTCDSRNRRSVHIIWTYVLSWVSKALPDGGHVQGHPSTVSVILVKHNPKIWNGNSRNKQVACFKCWVTKWHLTSGPFSPTQDVSHPSVQTIHAGYTKHLLVTWQPCDYPINCSSDSHRVTRPSVTVTHLRFHHLSVSPHRVIVPYHTVIRRHGNTIRYSQRLYLHVHFYYCGYINISMLL